MKFQPLDPPRVFVTGRAEPIHIRDYGKVLLERDEQITFITESGAEYDVARKTWGYYATPSLNGRLANFGLRAVLVKSFVGKYYVLLVERGHEAELAAYLSSEQNQIVRWLDNDTDLLATETEAANSDGSPLAHPSCMCGANRFTSVHVYFARPEGEVLFAGLNEGGRYRREIFQCSLCRHFVSVFASSSGADFYQNAYVAGTYGPETGLRQAFDRVINLPPNQSDNVGRVRRVNEYADAHFGDSRHGRTILDVGSGLCVFLHAMKQEGWSVTALDPDPSAARHARTVVGVEAVSADFMAADLPSHYDVISFNKVLEHVERPHELLARAARHLAPGGFIYVEVPDGEAASSEGFGREEFFIEHHHIFSAASLALLAARAGFSQLTQERLREPSTKFTLRAFLGRPQTPTQSSPS
jgi:SAM-dependent methyltransferase